MQSRRYGYENAPRLKMKMSSGGEIPEERKLTPHQTGAPKTTVC